MNNYTADLILAIKESRKIVLQLLIDKIQSLTNPEVNTNLNLYKRKFFYTKKRYNYLI